MYGTEEMERMRVRMSGFSGFCVFVGAGDVGGDEEDACSLGALEDLVRLD